MNEHDKSFFTLDFKIMIWTDEFILAKKLYERTSGPLQSALKLFWE